MSAPCLKCSEHLSWFHRRGRVYLYHDLYGDILEMSPDLRALLDAFSVPRAADAVTEAFAERIDQAQTSGFINVFIEHRCLISAEIDEHALLVDAFPCRGPWIVTCPDREGQLEAIVGRNPETPARSLRFTPQEAFLWRHIDGQHTIRSLAALLAEAFPDDLDAASALTQVARTVAAWTHSEAQLTRVSHAALSFYQHASAPRPAYLNSTMPFARIDDADLLTPDGERIDLRDYHRDTIQDASQQFDEVETTLSHLFRVPHPALNGETYAERMLTALESLGAYREEIVDVAEIGGGVGFFAEGLVGAIQRRHPEGYERLRYRVIDISPTLHASQTRKLERFGVHAQTLLMDAESLSLPDESLDLVISNEVIGDLLTARVTWTVVEGDEDPEEEEEEPPWFDPEEAYRGERDLPRALGGDPDAVALLQRYRVPLEDAPEAFFVNLGAIKLIERLWSALRPGGAAVLTEFGDLWQYPLESTQLDHAEFSIHFGQLRHIARAIGFRAEVEEVFEMIAFDGDAQTLACARTYFRNLKVLFERRGVRLEKIAYTRSMLEALAGDAVPLDELETLSWHRLEDRVMGLVPREFKALVLHKPAHSMSIR